MPVQHGSIGCLLDGQRFLNRAYLDATHDHGELGFNQLGDDERLAFRFGVCLADVERILARDEEGEMPDDDEPSVTRTAPHAGPEPPRYTATCTLTYPPIRPCATRRWKAFAIERGLVASESIDAWIEAFPSTLALSAARW